MPSFRFEDRVLFFCLEVFYASLPYTTPVGYYYGTGGRANSISPAGCYDMSGNVVEWCHDWYAASYYTSGPQTNPTGPASAVERVLRGGHFGSEALHIRTATLFLIRIESPKQAKKVTFGD